MDQMTLQKLMEVKEFPCLSIILPTYRTAPDNQKTSINLKRLFKQAEEMLVDAMGKKEAAGYVDKTKNLIEGVDISRTLDGLALFVSKEIALQVDLPFSVRERVILDKTFATREIIMAVNRGTCYYILDLSLHKVRLLKCYREHAEEVLEAGFPMMSDFDELVLNPSDFSSEKKKQIKEFFNRADKAFMPLYRKEPYPLILAGVQKNLAFYREIVDMEGLILDQMEGNFETTTPHDMGRKAWERVRENMKKRRHDALNELQKAVSQQKHAYGLPEVWTLAQEGRIGLLIVEENYAPTAQILPNNSLVLDVSVDGGNGLIPDAVDEVAETVLEKGGKVVFVDDGSMGNFRKIAAILRY